MDWLQEIKEGDSVIYRREGRNDKIAKVVHTTKTQIHILIPSTYHTLIIKFKRSTGTEVGYEEKYSNARILPVTF